MVRFKALKHSTSSIKFTLSNVKFQEEELIKKVTPLMLKDASTKKARVLKLGCNFGEVKTDEFVEPATARPSNRGRKRQLQLKNKRKTQGTGKYFNSQMTFYVKSDLSKFEAFHDPLKKQGLELYKLDKKQKNSEGEWKILSYIYKVKVFRNGKAQIPGLRTEFEKEAKQVLKPILNFFSKFFDIKVKATGFNKFIQNYKSCIVEDVQYEMDKLLKHFMSLEQGAYPKKIRRLKASAHSKLLIYFNTSEKLPNGNPKLTNLTIYRKGSINVDGAVSRESAEVILKYFKKILNKNPDLLYDPNASSSEEESTTESETSSEESSESSSNSSWDD